MCDLILQTVGKTAVCDLKGRRSLRCDTALNLLKHLKSLLASPNMMVDRREKKTIVWQGLISRVFLVFGLSSVSSSPPQVSCKIKLQQKDLNISVFINRLVPTCIHDVLLRDMPNSFYHSYFRVFDSVSVCLHQEPVGVADPPGLLHMAVCPRNTLL